jgi:hypothetical protein
MKKLLTNNVRLQTGFWRLALMAAPYRVGLLEN